MTNREDIRAVRVAIVDDHPIIRQGIRRLVERTEGMEVAGEAEDGVLALQLLREQKVDVVLLDITMPRKSGLDVLLEARLEHPNLRFLVLTMHDEAQYAIRSLRAGASGYLNKGSSPAELLEAIRIVADGGRYITPKVADRLVEAMGREGSTGHESLSDREFQVLQLTALGRTVKEIAETMLVSEKTVYTYRDRVKAKLALRNEAELVRYAVEHQLV